MEGRKAVFWVLGFCLLIFLFVTVIWLNIK